MRLTDTMDGTRLLRAAALCLVLSLGLATGARAQECGDIIRIGNHDTLFKIAERCGTTVGDIIRYNPNIDDPNSVQVGMMLFMPDKDRPFRFTTRTIRYVDDDQRQAAPVTQPAAYGGVGDDGPRYGGSGSGGYGTSAYTGTTYRYGAGAADPLAGGAGFGSAAGTLSAYTVREGDTMTSIADRFGTTVSSLLAVNPTIPNLHFLPVGVTLTIPPGAVQPVRQTTQAAAYVPRDEFGAAAPDRVSISPINGPPGSEVLLTATGLEPLSMVYLAAGPDAANRNVIGRVGTDARGNLVSRVLIPPQSRNGDRYVFVVLSEDYQVRAISNPFNVDPTVAWPATVRVAPDPVEVQPVNRNRGF